MNVCFAYKVNEDTYKIIKTDKAPNKYWNLMVVVDAEIENEFMYEIDKSYIVEERKYNANIQK